MDIEKLIETAKVCCGDIKSEDCSEQCIDPRDNRGTGEDRFCRQWLIHDLYTALSTLKAENEKLRAELEQVKRENDALWIYIEIVDREYQRYMDRGYIDRLDELKRTWRRGQKED